MFACAGVSGKLSCELLSHDAALFPQGSDQTVKWSEVYFFSVPCEKVTIVQRAEIPQCRVPGERLGRVSGLWTSKAVSAALRTTTLLERVWQIGRAHV